MTWPSFAPTGRRVVATGGAARPRSGPSRNPWKTGPGGAKVIPEPTKGRSCPAPTPRFFCTLSSRPSTARRGSRPTSRNVCTHTWVASSGPSRASQEGGLQVRTSAVAPCSRSRLRGSLCVRLIRREAGRFLRPFGAKNVFARKVGGRGCACAHRTKRQGWRAGRLAGRARPTVYGGRFATCPRLRLGHATRRGVRGRRLQGPLLLGEQLIEASGVVAVGGGDAGDNGCGG